MAHRTARTTFAMLGLLGLWVVGGSAPLLAGAEAAPAPERQFHFHHWSLSLDRPMTHATEGLWLSRWSPDTTLEQELAAWRERGVIAQHWRGGRWAYEHGYETPEKLVQHWIDGLEAGWSGIVIDEITADEEQRRVAGEALLQLAEAHPDLYVAVYVVPGVSGEKFVEGLERGADRVLVEAYQGSAVAGYGMIRSRGRAAVEHGLADKSLIVLGHGPEWITTARELRRQLHFVRYHFPEMDGVAFFGDTSKMYEGFDADVDRQLGMFYTQPVLRVEKTPSGGLSVRNIGGTASPPIEVPLARRGGGNPGRTLALPALAVGESFETGPMGVEPELLTRYGQGWCILGPPQLWTDEPAWMRTDAEGAWPAGRYARPHFAEAFNSPRPSDEAATAVRTIPGTEGAGFRAQFVLDVGAVGSGEMYRLTLGSAGGPGRIELSLARRQSVSGTHAYFTLTTQGEGDVIVREDIAFPLRAGERYGASVLYEPDGAARVMLKSLDAGRTWDTGSVPAPSGMEVDQVVFGVEHAKGEPLVRWDRQARDLVMAPGPDAEAGVRVQSVKVFR